MKAFLDCIPCIISQTIHILKKFEPNSIKREKIIKLIIRDLANQDITKHSPPSLTMRAHNILKKELGQNDLYIKEKEECNLIALSFYKVAYDLYINAEDKLETAIKIAIAGNLIDYGALREFNIAQVVNDYIHRPFAINDYILFKEILSKSKNIVYIGDNTGEIVFDKILVEELINHGCQVTYTVKSKAILNDSLMQDAIDVGMTKLTHVIESGSTTAGTLISESSTDFLHFVKTADLIISKGQGNLETISEENLDIPVFYLLLSKCNHISKALGINKFDLILMNDKNFIKLLHLQPLP